MKSSIASQLHGKTVLAFQIGYETVIKPDEGETMVYEYVGKGQYDVDISWVVVYKDGKEVKRFNTANMYSITVEEVKL